MTSCGLACQTVTGRDTVPQAVPRPIAPNDLTLDPAPDTWAALLQTPAADERTRRFRAQLGLPTDRPIVMSGHQVQFWHPGILAKLIAANELAERTGAAVAWMLVDHESPSPSSLHFPAIDPTGRFRVRGRTLDPTDNQRALSGPTFDPQAPELHAGWSPEASVASRLDTLVEAVRAQRSAGDKGAQLTEAQFEQLAPVTPPPVTLRVTDIARTDLFAELIEQLQRDPAAAHAAYNDAVAQHPESGMRPLAEDPEWGVELPLWVRTGAQHRPAFDRRDLPASSDIHADRFIPRALLSTGLMRLAGCDLFIHGFGGQRYEPVNDAWLAHWTNSPIKAGPAPFVAASADLRLELQGDTVTEADAARARWHAHHARHHPAAFNDHAAQRERDRLVADISEAPRDSERRRTLFAELHALLDTARSAHAAELTSLDERGADLAQAARETNIRTRRDWPAVLYPAAQLAALQAAIAAAFDA
ncbi:MAG: hypothetical protein AAF138_10315 [Planctomycetota bacterium]